MTGRTNIGAKFYIAVTALDGDIPLVTNSDLNLAGFTDIDHWAEVTEGIGQMGDTGVNQNMVGYPTWGRPLTVKQKGAAEGQDVELRMLSPKSGDESNGYLALLAASAVANGNNHAFKIIWSDDHVEYDRGLVGAPSFPKGQNESFRETVFPIGLNQEPVFDDETST